MKLRGRAAVITGASQGLGRAIAEAYIDEGASVLLTARGERELAITCEALAARRPTLEQRVAAVPADVGDISDVAVLRAAAERELSGIDIVVSNAGVYGPIGRFEEVDWDAWVDAIRTNLLGTAAVCRAFIPLLQARGGGKIVTLSGGGATAPLPRFSAYAAAKAAVVRLTETLAHELAADRIDVNAIAPGALNTRLLDEVLAAGAGGAGPEFHARAVKQKAEGGAPLDRAASLAVFLASPASDGITGRLISALWDSWAEPARARRRAGQNRRVHASPDHPRRARP